MYVPYACACTGKKNKIAASLDIEAWLVSRHGTETRLTNLSLNRLYFFAQVKSLRPTGMTVIGDPIEAWTQGKDTPITPDLILNSADIDGFDPDRTFAASVKRVEHRHRNTLRLLENSWPSSPPR